MERLVEWCIIGTSLCAKSEVWAAWVQGVGSVLAIAAAIGIAWWQRRADQQKHVRAEQDADQRALRMCSFFGVKLLECLQRHTIALHLQKAEKVVEEHAVLGDIAEWPGSLVIDRLPGEAIEAFLRLRSVAAVAVSHSVYVINAGAHLNFQHWTQVFDGLAESARLQIIRLASLGDALAIAATEND